MFDRATIAPMFSENKWNSWFWEDLERIWSSTETSAQKQPPPHENVPAPGNSNSALRNSFLS